jgi:hypothetical protein
MHQQLWGYNVEEKTSGGMRIRKAEHHWSKLFDPTQVSCQIIGIRFLTAVVMKSSTFWEQAQPFCQMLSHWPVWFILRYCRWRRDALLKRRLNCNGLYGVISQIILIFVINCFSPYLPAKCGCCPCVSSFLLTECVHLYNIITAEVFATENKAKRHRGNKRSKRNGCQAYDRSNWLL